VSLSRCQYQIHAGTSRVGRPHSMEVHIVAVDELGRPSPGAGPSSGAVTERRVHVSIPAQPWTQPFANVRLRQRAAHVINADKYRSSSGTALTVLQSSLFTSTLPGLESECITVGITTK